MKNNNNFRKFIDNAIDGVKKGVAVTMVAATIATSSGAHYLQKTLK